MDRTALTLTLVMIVAAFSGCASNGENSQDTTPTVPTTQATPTSPPTMTPTPSDEGPGLPDCPAPAASEGTPGNATELTFTISEPSATNPCYGIAGPSSAPSGWLKVTLQNDGREPHQLRFIALGNMSFEHYRQAMMMPAEADMDMHAAAAPAPYGGPQAGPGANTTALIHFDEGEYVIVCLIPGMNGMPHAMAGMVARFKVTNDTSDLVEPTANMQLDLEDYSFTWSDNVTSGDRVIKVTNGGPHHHEVVLIKLTGNHTSADFIAAFEPDAQGPPPLEILSGLSGMANGQSAYFWETFTPGNWALICFEQDSAEKPPHFVVGMVQDFVVA